jgi:hypothetical protein
MCPLLGEPRALKSVCICADGVGPSPKSIEFGLDSQSAWSNGSARLTGLINGNIPDSVIVTTQSRNRHSKHRKFANYARGEA